ncbi:MAG TPA: hypothetical protein VGK17_12715, partial [Propionicimonas sp.]
MRPGTLGEPAVTTPPIRYVPAGEDHRLVGRDARGGHRGQDAGRHGVREAADELEVGAHVGGHVLVERPRLRPRDGHEPGPGAVGVVEALHRDRRRRRARQAGGLAVVVGLRDGVEDPFEPA